MSCSQVSAESTYTDIHHLLPDLPGVSVTVTAKHSMMKSVLTLPISRKKEAIGRTVRAKDPTEQKRVISCHR